MVEDIGLRSSRIRLLTGHQVTVPNDELSRSHIENVGRRPHIRRISDIHIPLDTRRQKIDEAVTIIRTALDEHEGMDEASLREHEEVTKVKNVSFLEMGRYQMETWYFSPLPKELLGPGGFVEVLYVCEFTLHFFARKSELQRYQSRLPVDKRHPPGNEIYRKGNLAMFEVDGQEEAIYSQNLCYIAKLFLDHDMADTGTC